MVYEKGKKHQYMGTYEKKKVYSTLDQQPRYLIKRIIGYRVPNSKELFEIRKKFGRLENIVRIMTKK
jgi:hypothetical protein